MKSILKTLFYLSFVMSKYGIRNFLISATVEIYYSFIYLNFETFNFFKNKIYIFKKNEKYSTANIPTPFYFLYKIKSFYKKKNFDMNYFIDLGCGSGRTGLFFSTYFNLKFIGIDFDKIIIAKNKKEHKNKKNFYFYNFNLTNIKKLKLLLISLKKKNKNISGLTIFVSDSFDKYLIKKILLNLKKNFNFNFIMINQSDNNFFKEFKRTYYEEFQSKTFKKARKIDSLRNLAIYKI